MAIVECRDIIKYFSVQRGYLKKGAGVVKALDGVSLEIEEGETFGLVGESGCGKTTLGKILLGIISPDSGEVLLKTKEKQAIFQDPYSSLDPKMKVRDIISEGLILKKGSKTRLLERIEKVLDVVRLPKGSLNKYPHQFSGGERQRIAIARAVVTEPEFIVCDEPVSNLDVTIQLQILKLLKEIQEKFRITYLFISHDLRVIKFMCDRVAVMKDGKIVENRGSKEIFTGPVHPYTKLLLSSIPRIF
ncbi:MAG: hypothetical protein A2987_00850 [Omnitrophica bacterium RIFCSPLOWO2_01_FULL_45_10]|nr:MAG: hypothetical protein A2987_00850 [Omnitrophica bacterium RIFCSPLOWO2_01_FULL_45_10]